MTHNREQALQELIEFYDHYAHGGDMKEANLKRYRAALASDRVDAEALKRDVSGRFPIMTPAQVIDYLAAEYPDKFTTQEKE